MRHHRIDILRSELKRDDGAALRAVEWLTEPLQRRGPTTETFVLPDRLALVSTYREKPSEQRAMTCT